MPKSVQEATDAFAEYLRSDRNDYIEFLRLKEEMFLAQQYEKLSRGKGKMSEETKFDYERKIKRLEKENKFLKIALKELSEQLATVLSECFREDKPDDIQTLEAGVKHAVLLIRRYRQEAMGKTPSIIDKLLSMEPPKNMSNAFQTAILNFMQYIDGEEVNFGKYMFLKEQVISTMKKDVEAGHVPAVLMEAANVALTLADNPEDLAKSLAEYRKRKNMFDFL